VGSYFIAVTVRDISPCVSSRKSLRCESAGLSATIRTLVAPAGTGGIASMRSLRAFGWPPPNSNIIQPPPLTAPTDCCARTFESITHLKIFVAPKTDCSSWTTCAGLLTRRRLRGSVGDFTSTVSESYVRPPHIQPRGTFPTCLRMDLLLSNLLVAYFVRQPDCIQEVGCSL
jgi:hypothetical protein